MLVVIRKKYVVGICMSLAVLIAVGGVLFGGNSLVSTVSKTDWGLGYGESGQVPTGNKSQQELAPLNAFYLGDTSQKKIYITFDAGFENGNTAKILDALKKHKVPATFFLVGNYIEKEPDLVKRMIAEGHHVGNHTMHHPDMSKISDETSFRQEIEKLEELYKSVTGKDIEKLYRPPQGKFSEKNLEMAKNMGYKTFFWSLAYVDWIENNQPTKEQAFSKLIPRIHNGAIVLLHSTSKTNADILDELLTKWEEMGYSFGDLTEL